MTTHRFRFGVAVGAVPTGKDLLTTAQRIEQLGYSTMVVADGLWLPAPFQLLAAAAAATSTLHLGTHVLSAPLRAPATVAQETDTLDVLSDHRFELGLGTGHDGTRADARRLGVPFASRTERRARIVEVITAVREQFAVKDREPPRILLAGVGPRLVSLAAEHADTLALPVGYDQPEDGLERQVRELRSVTGGRFDDLELATNQLIVGDRQPPAWVPRQFRELPADSYGRLAGDPGRIADTLRRRRDLLGISYVTIPQWHLEDFAPVVELLADS
ncbi:MAG: LLM class flavin-dependent oxidoreductase [Streptosporangiales bacterium]|nr:LLM class flavin-dependent oxidoreductase [Streptosporangiales bacterium]MBO0890105.1 LLM class flavin-dependent oxidoreductase [Acidothermales bacterium]